MCAAWSTPTIHLSYRPPKAHISSTSASTWRSIAAGGARMTPLLITFLSPPSSAATSALALVENCARIRLHSTGDHVSSEYCRGGGH
eukprot:scaffold49771_cov65-Phaeocystis_antarctica.AAC.4